MLTASALRTQIEATLHNRIPSALTPSPRLILPMAPTGIGALDERFGGLPIGAITEIVGQECSGRTSCVLSFLARTTQAGKVCAWIDVSDTFHPQSAAAAGVDLKRLLWVRCGVSQAKNLTSSCDFHLPEKYLHPPVPKKGLHGGGFGPHPRGEAKGLSQAVSTLLRSPARVSKSIVPEAGKNMAPENGTAQGEAQQHKTGSKPQSSPAAIRRGSFAKPWRRLDQALRVSDLLLQSGGFSAIVLDMGSIAAEQALRVPLTTWFRYRAAAERSRASFLLLTQSACARSSAGFVLHFGPGTALEEDKTVFPGIAPRATAVRERFQPAPLNVVPLKKPPQREDSMSWHCRTPWSSRNG